MAPLERQQLEALNRLFTRFALKDQKDYYRFKSSQYRHAAAQVNGLRATFAFLTGASSALAGLIVATQSPEIMSEQLIGFIGILTILSVILPALGGAFTTLADLYQWDRTVAIYEAALESIGEADALSPVDTMDDLVYRASLRAYAEVTLTVMREETAQWGQLIKVPVQLEQFIEEERRRAEGGDKPDGG
jgi:hypothetical protein